MTWGIEGLVSKQCSATCIACLAIMKCHHLDGLTVHCWLVDQEWWVKNFGHANTPIAVLTVRWKHSTLSTQIVAQSLGSPITVHLLMTMWDCVILHVYVKVVVPAGKVVTSPLGSVDILDPHKDKPKLFTLILLDDTTEYSKLFKIATACEKRRKKRVCKSGVVEGWEECVTLKTVCAEWESVEVRTRTMRSCYVHRRIQQLESCQALFLHIWITILRK